MQAFIFHETGDIRRVLKLESVAAPQLQPGQALVKLRAAPIHPADGFFVAGRYRINPSLPQVAGLEGCGEIVAIAPSTEVAPTFAVGDRVVFRYPGTWAESLAVPLDELYPVPAELNWAEAALSFLNPFTALGLLQKAQVKRGDFVLATAAHSTVGRWLAEFARTMDLHLIGLIRNHSANDQSQPSTLDLCLTEADIDVDRICALSRGGVAAALDCVGGRQGQAAFDSLKAEGKMIQYGDLSQRPLVIRNSDIVYKNLEVSGFGIRAYMGSLSRQEITDKLNMIAQVVRASQLLDQRFEYPLAAVPQALQAVHKNSVIVFEG